VTYALIAGAIAALAAVAAGYPLVAALRGRDLGKAISSEGPESHLSKAGTPTMGGLLIVAVGIAAGLAFGVPKDRSVLLPIAVAAVMAGIGWYDDLGTLINRAQRQAHDRTGMILKLIGFTAVAIVAAYVLYDRIDAPRLLVPHYGEYDIGPVYLAIAVAAIVLTTSAVGVADGLDMLAGGCAAIAFSAYGAMALLQDATGLAAFCFGMAGALLGFLWFNAYPARVIMGDTGSLALGASLAVAALMTGWWLLLPLVAVAFAADLISDVIQIGYFRLTGGKRVFRMAPVHHHFEKLGMHETQVSVRFVLVTAAASLVAVGLAAWG